jgi:hypothetical protein
MRRGIVGYTIRWKNEEGKSRIRYTLGGLGGEEQDMLYAERMRRGRAGYAIRWED